MSQDAAGQQTLVGSHTNLAHLAEKHPDLAYEEYKRRESCVPDNVHTPLRATQQAKLAKAGHKLKQTLRLELQWLQCECRASFLSSGG
ncbi:hypothetical protein ABBQ32_013147 [Trebouxia sp. C0010 RCD-2024]